MTEEVSSEHIAEKIITEPIIPLLSHSDVPNLENARLDQYPVIFERLQKTRDRRVAELKVTSVLDFMKKLSADDAKKIDPELIDFYIDNFADLFFGPFSLEQSEINSDTRVQELTLQRKEISARIQHNIAHAWYRASQQDASDSYVKTMHESITLFEFLVNSDFGKHEHLKVFMNGTKAELSLIKLFKNNGFKIFLPDYLQDPFVNEEDNEVLALDVKKGIDMVAEKSGIVYLINAKGQGLIKDKAGNLSRRKEADVVRERTYLDDKNNSIILLPKPVRSLIHELKPFTVTTATITLPMLSTDTNLAKAYDAQSQRNAIAEYCRPSTNIQTQVI